MPRRIHDNIKSDIGPRVSTSAVAQPLNLLEVLDGVEFPVSKMELISYAEDRGASEDILDQLQGMPDDIYNTLSDVNRHANNIEIIEESGNLWSSEDSHDLPDEAERFVSDLNGMGRI